MNGVKSKVFIFHGTGGNPNENWFPWLKEKLEKKGNRVIIPQFPEPERPLLDNWLQTLDSHKSEIDQNTVLIGHSLGGLFLLRVLERLNKPVKAVFFVGAPVGVKPIKFYEGDERFSPGFSFDWRKIRSSANQFTVFHSDNDPYISLGNGQKLARELGVDLTFIPNAGHFNTSSGYTLRTSATRFRESFR
jgi:predicted alpha/beta hydrolase family esterase